MADWTPPERIYLQPSQWPEVTWCSEPVVEEGDPDGPPNVEYVRADLVERLRKEHTP